MPPPPHLAVWAVDAFAFSSGGASRPGRYRDRVLQQSLAGDRFAQEIGAARGHAFGPLLGHRVGRQCDDRRGESRGAKLAGWPRSRRSPASACPSAPGRTPLSRRRRRQLDGNAAVLGDHHLDAGAAEVRREQLLIVLAVLGQQHPPASQTGLNAGRAAAISKSAAQIPRASRRPPLNRRRSRPKTCCPRRGSERTAMSPPSRSDEALADRQPQPGAAEAPGRRVIGLREGLEQPCDLLVAHADAAVADVEVDHTAVERSSRSETRMHDLRRAA